MARSGRHRKKKHRKSPRGYKKALGELRAKLDKYDRERERLDKERSKILQKMDNMRQKFRDYEPFDRFTEQVNMRRSEPVRISSVSDHIAEQINPQPSGRYTKRWIVNYRVYLLRYGERNKNRNSPNTYEPMWEDKEIVIRGTDTDFQDDIRTLAPEKIEDHWQTQKLSGTDVQIDFEHQNWDYDDRFDENNMKDWLVIEQVLDVTHDIEHNDLPAFGLTWKLSLQENLTTTSFKLRDGSCWLDYLDQKLSGKPSFRYLTRNVIQQQLFKLTRLKSGWSTNQVVDWIISTKKPISLIALDAAYEVTKAYAPPRRQNLVTLCYVLTNQHIFPLENQQVFNAFSEGCLNKLRNWEHLASKFKAHHKPNYQNFLCYDKSHHRSIDFIKGDLDNSKDVIYFQSDDFAYRELLEAIIKETGFTPVHIRPHLKSFIHPRSNQLYVETSGYDTRQAIALACKEKYDWLNFTWCNQSVASMSKTIYQARFGEIIKSSHTQLAMKLLDDFATMPLTAQCDDKVCEFDMINYHIDKRVCYASATVDILSNHDLPIFTVFNNIEPYTKTDSFQCGLYLVNEFTIKKYSITFQTQWLPHFEVEYLINKGYITHKDITLQYLSEYRLDGSLLSEYVEYLFNTFPKKIANPLWHHFYGCFNTKRYRENIAFITRDENEAISYYTSNRGKVSITPLKEALLVDKKINERINIDNCGLYSCVLGSGHIKLLEMVETLPHQDRFIVRGVRTDSIYVSYPNDDQVHMEEWIEHYCDTSECKTDNALELAELKPYKIECEWNVPSKQYVFRIDKINIKDYDLDLLPIFDFDKTADYSNKNILVQGAAGSYKTGVLIKYYKIYKAMGLTIKVIAFTNVARENLIKRGVDPSDAFTVCSFLGMTRTELVRATSNRVDKILVDEYSMIGRKLYIQLLKKIKNIVSDCFNIHFYGDYDQCGSVEDEVKHKIIETQFLKEILGSDGLVLNKKYEPMYDSDGNLIQPRCDDKIISIYKHLKKYKRLPQNLFRDKKLWVDYKTVKSNLMICKNRNNKKQKITVSILNNRLYDTITSGCIVICNENDKTLNVWNGQRFVVQKIINKTVHCTKWQPNPTEKKPSDIFEIPIKYLTVAHAETVYKYQGLTLYEKYIIFQMHQMSLQEVITAITRAQKFDQLRFTNRYSLAQWFNDIKPKYFYDIYDKKYHDILDLKQSSQYTLYMLVYGNDGYIGFSENEQKRLIQHELKKDCACKHFDFNKTKLVVLGKFYATSRKECENIENAYIQDYHKFSDKNIVNVRGNNNKVVLKQKQKTKKPKLRQKRTTDTYFKINEYPDDYAFKISGQLGEKPVFKKYKRRGRDVVLAEMEKIRADLLKKHNLV